MKPEPVRIERFIEKRFKVHPEYDQLAEGLLGYSRFGPKGIEKIVVARALSESGSRVAERQINSTLAHEAGHVLLHGHLFVFDCHSLTSLFGSDLDPSGPTILCRDPIRPEEKKRYSGQWWEYQANQAIGALLLPRPLVLEALSGLLLPRGSFGWPTLETTEFEKASMRLADVFDVNPAAARIRLNGLFPEIESGQLTL